MLKIHCPLQQQASSNSRFPNEFTILQERIVFRKNLPTTAATTIYFTNNNEFTVIQERMVFKKPCPIQQQLPSTSPPPNKFTIIYVRMVFKNLPATAAITMQRFLLLLYRFQYRFVGQGWPMASLCVSCFYKCCSQLH